MLSILIYVYLSISVDAHFFSPISKVINLNAKNFEEKVLKSDKIWLIEFYAPWCGVSQNFVPEYEKAANALGGIIGVGAVNVEQHRELQRKYRIRSYPTIKMFVDKQHPEEFRGRRKAKYLVEAAMRALKKKANYQLTMKTNSNAMKNVVTLTDNNFYDLVIKSSDIWLVKFHSPWCQECKNMIGMWNEAAERLKGKARFGHVDASVQKIVAQEYDIRKVPTLKYFLPGKRKKVFDFKANNITDIIELVEEKFAVFKSPPDVHQIIHTRSFSCRGEQLCIITFLPKIPDCPAKCRNGYLDTLKSIAEKFKNKHWNWLWSEAGAQPSLEGVFRVNSYPAMVAVNTKKKIFAFYNGSFLHKEINRFLKDIVKNRATVEIMENRFGIEATELWVGEDGNTIKTKSKANETKLKERFDEVEKDNVEVMDIEIKNKKETGKERKKYNHENMGSSNPRNKINKATEKDCNETMKEVSKYKIMEEEGLNKDDNEGSAIEPSEKRCHKGENGTRDETETENIKDNVVMETKNKSKNVEILKENKHKNIYKKEGENGNEVENYKGNKKDKISDGIIEIEKNQKENIIRRYDEIVKPETIVASVQQQLINSKKIEQGGRVLDYEIMSMRKIKESELQNEKVKKEKQLNAEKLNEQLEEKLKNKMDNAIRKK